MYKISNKDEIKRYAGNIFRNGLPKGVSTGIPNLDPHYKYRKGELDVNQRTCLYGSDAG